MDSQKNIELSVVVSDLNLAISFYCHTLKEFEVFADLQMEHSRLVRLRHRTIAFGLYLVVPNTEDYKIRFGARQSSRLAISLPVDDCEETLESLASISSPILSEIVDAPWGRGFAFEDPFGNRIDAFESYCY